MLFLFICALLITASTCNDLLSLPMSHLDRPHTIMGAECGIIYMHCFGIMFNMTALSTAMKFTNSVYSLSPR